MILTGAEIARQVKLGDIRIEPFSDEQVNPNSYDFRLGNTIKYYSETILDPAKENKVVTQTIDDAGFVLKSDIIYLAHTEEVIGSDHFVPIIRARSSLARLGVFVHVTADLIDLGSYGQLTLQLHAVQPIRLYPGLRVGQVTFWKPLGPIVQYDGKYQNSRGPMQSLSYLDWIT